LAEPEFIRLCTGMCEDQEWMVVGVYAGPIPGQYELDRIQVYLTVRGEKPRGWIMTVSEARSLICGLQMAVERAEQEGWDDAGRK